MNMSFDFVEIITEAKSHLDPVYLEATNDINNGTEKGFNYIKNFIGNIEDIANKKSVKDDRISASKGNIKNFSGYKSIEASLDFLSKNLGSVDIVKDSKKLLDNIERYTSLYSDGYDKKVRLIQLEYESAVYCLTTVLSLILADGFDIVANGTEIKIIKKEHSKDCLAVASMKELNKQLSADKHKSYLEELLKEVDKLPVEKTKLNTESVMLFKEASLGDTLTLLGSIWSGVKKVGTFTKNAVIGIKRSLFGIIPVVRGIMYLRDKKKADTVSALEEQITFIQYNIEQLKNKKTNDPKKRDEIIKKQKKVIEAYQKKAAKLRAELLEGEKDATKALNSDSGTLKKQPTKKQEDDEFTLESTNIPKIHINDLKDVKTSTGIPYTEMTDAENELGVRFNKEFIDVVYEYGNVKSKDFELLGLGNENNVVEATFNEWALNNKVPHDMYVIENTMVEDVVVWQDNEGMIYESYPNCTPIKISDSLASYLTSKEYEVSEYEE